MQNNTLQLPTLNKSPNFLLDPPPPCCPEHNRRLDYKFAPGKFTSKLATFNILFARSFFPWQLYKGILGIWAKFLGFSRIFSFLLFPHVWVRTSWQGRFFTVFLHFVCTWVIDMCTQKILVEIGDILLLFVSGFAWYVDDKLRFFWWEIDFFSAQKCGRKREGE